MDIEPHAEENETPMVGGNKHRATEKGGIAHRRQYPLDKVTKSLLAMHDASHPSYKESHPGPV